MAWASFCDYFTTGAAISSSPQLRSLSAPNPHRHVGGTKTPQEPVSGAKLLDTGATDEAGETKRETEEQVRALQITGETLGHGLLVRTSSIPLGPSREFGRSAARPHSRVWAPPFAKLRRKVIEDAAATRARLVGRSGLLSVPDPVVVLGRLRCCLGDGFPHRTDLFSELGIAGRKGI